MSTMVFVNFPVRDLVVSETFYTAIGFKKNEGFSNEMATAMVWDDHFWIMLLTHGFYQQFIDKKTIGDAKTTSSSLIAFSVDSAETVKKIGEIALKHGGQVHHVDMGTEETQMYGLEVQDPDGNTLEPTWMDVSGI